MLKLDNRNLAAAYGRALARLNVGLTGASTPDCEWYEGIMGDAASELETLQAIIDKRTSEGCTAMLEVDMLSIFDYETPDQVPAIDWIQRSACFAHVGNGSEAGVWEFIVNVECFNTRNSDPIPEELVSYFDDAKANGMKHICFFQ